MSRPTWSDASLMRQLLLWSLGALILVWACFVFLAYRTGVEEADELTDGHLASVAVLLLGIHGLPAIDQSVEPLRLRQEGLKNHDYQQSLSVLVWDAQGRLSWRSGEAPVLAFDAAAEGYATVIAGEEPLSWRSFSQWNREHTQKVAVMLQLDERDALAHDIAGQMIEPGLWLLPVVSLALGLAISRGLRPLMELSNAVAALDVQNADSLVARHPLREFDSVVESINTLLARQQQALFRERQLANEVAHELRTPLASIVLQAQALEATLEAEAPRAALARIRADTLRVGHVLDQLLALARSSRDGAKSGWQQIDLAQLARTVAADYAQAAWERNDVIEVQADASLTMSAQPVLLGIALRNLVENALRHTPFGTRIAIQCGRDQVAGASVVWLQVCDDGERQGSSAERPLADSLHLGHEIVARVAAEHGAQFRKSPCASPFTTCYRIDFLYGPQNPAG
ncbi:MAG: two-component sensor histidine kinase [Simplicispira suum]|uniref:histidine kinase dimerization/phospho-acceptor domain-containing protein n=1 Tax=Simplicispira suum TaxID=2109915 RepID=UPI001C6AFAC7|nr:histidine kinase dimerization/phospho-acceptor domain-containing protein [Simplicispira suum]MBW7834250.1 two-component sensor histidine kinase [Simplicispira suum]